MVMNSPIVGISTATLIIVGIYALSGGQAKGYFVAYAIGVSYLITLQCVSLEIGTYAGNAYVLLWSFIHIVWTSIVWTVCAALCWATRVFRGKAPKK